MASRTSLGSLSDSDFSSLSNPIRRKRLSEKFLSELSDRIPLHWEKVGVNLFVNARFMRRLQSRASNRAEVWPLRMLNLWAERCDQDVDIVELCEELENIHRNDLVVLVRSRLPGTSSLRKDDETLHGVLQDLSTKLALDWYSLGLQLEIPSDSLEIIRVNAAPAADFKPAREMLLHWNKEYEEVEGQKSQLDRLKDALSEAHRRDLVTWIDGQNPEVLYARKRSIGKCPSPSPYSESGADTTLGLDSVSQTFQHLRLTDESPFIPQSVDGGLDTVDAGCIQQQEPHTTENGNDGGSSDYHSATETQLGSEEGISLATSVDSEADKHIALSGGNSNVPVPRKLEGKLSCDSIRSSPSDILQES